MAKTPTKVTDAAADHSDASDLAAGKGRPTPTRREKEAARKRPLVSSDRSEARRRSRQQATTERERARIGMANGEEKYLPVRDRGVQKRFVRDYIDARFSVAEMMIPILVVYVLGSLVPGTTAQTILLFVIWAFVLVAVIDVIIVGRRIERRLAEKYGKEKVEKVRMYAAMRALQFRPLRLPKPQVKRGQKPA
ncbi:MAG: hypothetical protein JWR53_790 [Glaciihabitans sp.]|nr:hypothetical protein [Glaciihabitans sp.]